MVPFSDYQLPLKNHSSHCIKILFFLFCFSLRFLLRSNHRSTKKKKHQTRASSPLRARPHFSRSQSRRRWPPDEDHHGLQINLVISLCFGFQICFWISYLIVWFVSQHPRTPLWCFFSQASMDGRDDGGIVGERTPKRDEWWWLWVKGAERWGG